jgi:hypothetical protein
MAKKQRARVPVAGLHGSLTTKVQRLRGAAALSDGDLVAVWMRI